MKISRSTVYISPLAVQSNQYDSLRYPYSTDLLSFFKVSAKESLEDLLSLQDEVLVQLGLTEQSQVGCVKDVELSLDEYEVRRGLVAGIRLQGSVDVFL